MSQNPYQPGPYGGTPYGQGPDHPRATTVLVLGIVGLVACQLASPFAWVMGSRAVRDIDDSDGRIGGRSMANAGRICGIVGTVLLVLSLIAVVVVVVVVLSAPEIFDDNYDRDPYYDDGYYGG